MRLRVGGILNRSRDLHFWVLLVVLALTPGFSAQGEKTPAESSSHGKNQIAFKKKDILLVGKRLSVEIADRDELRELGLMYRQSLPPNHGMLFVFNDEKPRSFWMKNTFIPLSIGFFDSDRKFLESLEMQPVRSLIETPKTYSSQLPAKYALELPGGWFQKNKVDVGQRFEFVDKGPKP